MRKEWLVKLIDLRVDDLMALYLSKSERAAECEDFLEKLELQNEASIANIIGLFLHGDAWLALVDELC
jgi:hypothetical protein